MSRVARPLIVLMYLLLQACSASETPIADQTQLEPSPVATASPATEASSSSPVISGISADQVRNADYQPGGTDIVRLVPLTGGRYQEGRPGDADYFSITMTEFITSGDLNGDGVNEAAALVAENYGGSGVFVFLAVYEEKDGTPAYLTSILLDDRPIISGLSIEDGEIFVSATIHGVDDSMCCPTLPTTRHYQLNGSNLTLVDYGTRTPSGQPRVITIISPVNGADASGIVQIKGSVTIAPFENSLVYRVVDMGGVELSVGPVAVDAPDPGAPGDFDQPINLGNILSGATVRIVIQDLSPADGSMLAMDSVIVRIR